MCCCTNLTVCPLLVSLATSSYTDCTPISSLARVRVLQLQMTRVRVLQLQLARVSVLQLQMARVSV